jgi:hypothetical protein
MSRPPLPTEAVDVLRKANPAVITTLRADGQPVGTEWPTVSACSRRLW